MTARQLHAQDMHTLATFLRACNDGVPSEATFDYYLVCVSLAI